MDMNIEEVKDILGICRMLRVPKHIFITDEPVYEKQDGMRFYKGLQPSGRGDVIFLSAQADVTTVPHEMWHANTGLGELTAYPVGNLLAAKYRVLSRFPAVKDLLTRKVEYAESSNPTDFPQAEKYRGRLKHYTLVG
jgi:hypothetical protein